MSTLMALIIVLAILMTIVGGETGIRSFFSVLINTLLLILVAMLISWGINIAILTLIFIPRNARLYCSEKFILFCLLGLLDRELVYLGLPIFGTSCRTWTRGRRTAGRFVTDARLELPNDRGNCSRLLNSRCDCGSSRSDEFRFA